MFRSLSAAAARRAAAAHASSSVLSGSSATSVKAATTPPLSTDFLLANAKPSTTGPFSSGLFVRSVVKAANTPPLSVLQAIVKPATTAPLSSGLFVQGVVKAVTTAPLPTGVLLQGNVMANRAAGLLNQGVARTTRRSCFPIPGGARFSSSSKPPKLTSNEEWIMDHISNVRAEAMAASRKHNNENVEFQAKVQAATVGARARDTAYRRYVGFVAGAVMCLVGVFVAVAMYLLHLMMESASRARQEQASVLPPHAGSKRLEEAAASSKAVPSAAGSDGEEEAASSKAVPSAPGSDDVAAV